MKNSSEILLYQTEDGQTKIQVKLEGETVWLSIDQLAELFQKSRSTINEHIINIFNEKELDSESVVRKIGNSDFSTKPTSICRSSGFAGNTHAHERLGEKTE